MRNLDDAVNDIHDHTGMVDESIIENPARFVDRQIEGNKELRAVFDLGYPNRI